MVKVGTARTTAFLRMAAVAAAVCVAVSLAGCSGTAAKPSSSTPKPSASKASHPKPTPTPTFAALQYTCENIIPPATLAVFKSKSGFALQTDYLQRMKNIGSNLVTFNSYGGILCQWAYPDAQNSVDYAFSPITAAQATAQQSILTSSGYVGSKKDHGTLYANTDVADYPDEYLFIDGYWFQASSSDVMELLVDNVFVTS